MDRRVVGSMRFPLVSVTAFLVSLLTSVSLAVAQDAPICESDPDPCDVENFEGVSTGNKGSSFSAGGFVVEAYNAGDLQVEQLDWMEKSLFFSCHSNYIDLRNERDYVNLVYKGYSDTHINFIAVDNSGNVVDETTRINQTDDGAQVVTLGPAGTKIERIYLHHVTDTTEECQLTCTEPYISEIRACDVNLSR